MLDLLWHQIEPLLQLAVDTSEGETTTEDIYIKTRNGDVLILCMCDGPIIDAVLTLQVITYLNGKRALCMPMVGGKYLDEWMNEGMEVVLQIARDMKCEEVRGYAARTGWLRKLKHTKWKELYTTICYKVD